MDVRWVDEKNNLVARVLPDSDFFSISVLGPIFTEKKTKAFLECYKTKEEKIIDYDERRKRRSR